MEKNNISKCGVEGHDIFFTFMVIFLHQTKCIFHYLHNEQMHLTKAILNWIPCPDWHCIFHQFKPAQIIETKVMFMYSYVHFFDGIFSFSLKRAMFLYIFYATCYRYYTFISYKDIVKTCLIKHQTLK